MTDLGWKTWPHNGPFTTEFRPDPLREAVEQVVQALRESRYRREMGLLEQELHGRHRMAFPDIWEALDRLLAEWDREQADANS